MSMITRHPYAFLHVASLPQRRDVCGFHAPDQCDIVEDFLGRTYAGLENRGRGQPIAHDLVRVWSRNQVLFCKHKTFKTHQSINLQVRKVD